MNSKPCALGMILTVLILISSVTVNQYVRTSAATPTPGTYPVITPDNVARLTPIRLLSRGTPERYRPRWSDHGTYLVVPTDRFGKTTWVYRASDFNLPPHRLTAAEDELLDFWSDPDGAALLQSARSEAPVVGGQKVTIAPHTSSALSPHRKYIAYSPADQPDITLLAEIATGRQWKVFGYPDQFSPDDNLLVTWAKDGHALQLWSSKTGQLLRTLTNSFIFEEATFSPDSTLLLTHEVIDNPFNPQSRTQLWRVARGNPIATFDDPLEVIFTSDGSWIYLNELDRQSLWNIKTRQRKELNSVSWAILDNYGYCTKTLYLDQDHLVVTDITSGAATELHDPVLTHFEGSPGFMAFRPDLSLVAYVSGDLSVVVDDPVTGKQVARFNDFMPQPSEVLFSPDSRSLAVYAKPDPDHPATLKLWRLDAEVLPTTLLAPLTDPDVVSRGVPSPSFAFSRDGRTITTLSPIRNNLASQLLIWDTASGSAQSQKQIVIGGSGLLSPDAARFVSPRGKAIDPISELWDATTGKQIGTLPDCVTQVTAMAFSADGQTFACTNRTGDIYLWDAATGRQGKMLTGCTRDGLSALHFSPDGRILACSHRDVLYGIAQLRELGTGRLLAENIGLRELVGLNHQGTLFLGIDSHGLGQVWSVQTPDQPFIALGLKTSNGLLGWAFSPDDSLLVSAGAAASDGSPSTDFWNATTGAPLTVGSLRDQIRAPLAFSPDGTLLVTGSPDGSLQLWAVTPN